ncbi:uvrD/REP helicase N-terminal domain protein [Mycobacterium xenopi 3993]|nr:uvrD/REP helicase N-terminal domain protein [Mycobacterium xenopi 3993]
MLDPGLRGRVRILGGPGTGKTTLLVDAAAAHIGAGADPESVLLLTGSGRVGTRARSALTTALLRSRADGPLPPVVREPLVRTVHSYAFAVLRLAAQRAGDAAPRLVTTAEQDAIIRELLAGDIADGPAAAVKWPSSCVRHWAPPGSPPNFATCWRVAPSAGSIPCNSSGWARCMVAPNGSPPANSRNSTSR